MNEIAPRRAWVPSARRRRIQVVAQVLALVLSLAGLVLGANELGRYGAESLIARNVRSATGVPVRPQVQLENRFVLPDLLRGAYGQVRVTTRAISSGPLRVDLLDTRLTDVRLPLRDVLLQDSRRFGIGTTQEVAMMTYSDLNAYLAATGRPLVLSRADDGTLTLAGRVVVLGREVDTAAEVDLTVSDASLVIAPTRVLRGTAGLDGVERLLLGQRLILRVPLGTLPFGHDLRSARSDPDAVRIELTGSAVVVQP